MKLAVVSCVFDLERDPRRLANYQAFARQLEQLPFFLIEGRRSESHDWPKERLLNEQLEQLPAEFDAVAWIDADVLFLNPDWYQATVEQLQRFPVVQMFELAHWINQAGQIERQFDSSARVGGCFEAGDRFGHCGFAWAARREILEQCGGLFDQDQTGFGDAWMAHAFYNERRTRIMRAAAPELRTAALAWCDRYRRAVGQGSVGCTPGHLVHLWHGDYRDRRYFERFLDEQRRRMRSS